MLRTVALCAVLAVLVVTPAVARDIDGQADRGNGRVSVSADRNADHATISLPRLVRGRIYQQFFRLIDLLEIEGPSDPPAYTDGISDTPDPTGNEDSAGNGDGEEDQTEEHQNGLDDRTGQSSGQYMEIF
jgi:hypothetical protein